MSAVNQIFVGLFSAVGAVVAGITRLVDKWYPVYTREVSSSVRYINGKTWIFTTGQGVATSDNGIDWTTVWPTSELNLTGEISLNDMAFGNGLYVIVGGIAPVTTGTSLILTSPDGVNWTRRTTSNTAGLSSIDYSPTLGLFLAAGQSGTTVFSSDGITWTSGANAGTVRISKVVWGGTQFALLNTASPAQVYRSSNGTSFTVQSTALGNPVNDIAYSPSLNLWAISRASASTSYVMTSPDLITWTARTVTGAAGSATGIVWANTRFVVTSNVGAASSIDGVTWALVNNSVTQLGKMVVMPNNAIVAAGWLDKGVAISYTNGVSWGTSLTEIDTLTGQLRSSTRGINAITYSGGRYWISPTSGGQLFYSTDKKVWFTTTLPAGTAGTSHSAVYASQATTPYWVSPGTTGTAGRILSSTDGETWVLRTGPAAGTSWIDAATNGTLTVLINSDGSYTTTTDGVTFTASVKPVNSLRSIIFAGGKFVAVGASTALYSLNGTTWTNVSASFGAFSANRVVHDGTQFVAVGAGSATVNTKVSADGITWTTGPVAPWGATSVSSFAHNGSVFAAITSLIPGVAYAGTTLANLAPVTLSTAVISAVNGLVAVNGEITLQTNDNNLQLTSTNNGATWQVWETAEPITSTALNIAINSLGLFEGDVVSYLPNFGSFRGTVGRFDPETNAFTKFAVNPAAGLLSVSSITKSNLTYVAGLYGAATVGNISTSTDLLSWTSRLSIAAQVRSIAVNAASTRIVAGTHSGSTTGILGAYTSIDDGVTWNQINTSLVPHNVSKVINAAGKFLLVGPTSASQGAITSLSDTLDFINTFNAGATVIFNDIAYGNNIYVAVASGTASKIYSSPDGVTWTARGTTAFTSLHSIAFGAGRFWALGLTGAGYTSTDGITWAPVVMSPSNIAGLTWDGIDSFYAMSVKGSLYKYTPQ